MKKEYEILYSLKIDFDKNTENPSRLFKSMSLLIDSFKDFDSLLSRTLDNKINTIQILDEIKVGSLITSLKNFILIDDQKNLGDKVNQDSVQRYYNNCKLKVFETINDNKTIDNLKIVEKLEKDLENVAIETGVKNTILYHPVDKIDLVQNLKNISDSVKDLNDSDNVIYLNDKDNPTKINKNCEVHIDKIEEALIDREDEIILPLILKIKKPDYLGESKWELKFGRQSIDAKILDDNWLNDFHKRKILTAPGDSLDCNVKQINKYDKKGNLLDTIYEILNIKSIIEFTVNEKEIDL